jgi:phosphohistidine phosphatase
MAQAELYLVRHAIAAERGEEWPDDTKRPLTERGIARFKEVVAGLRWLDVALDEIITSPLVRAKQTAELLATGIEGKPVVRLLDALAPGHEPDLGELAAHLVGASRPMPFRKGGVCRIDVETLTSKRAGTLHWFLPPKALRKLGE